MLLKAASSVLKRISHAAMRSGRSPEEIALVAVTKKVGIEKIRDAIDTGLRVFGESRIQEAVPKIDRFRDLPGVKWHFIGTLQSNKAKRAVELFDLIESVDSLELASLIDRYAQEQGKVQRIYVQVKLGDEESKHGLPPSRVEEFARKASELLNVRIEGLMTIPPFYEDAEKSRPYFRELRDLRDGLVRKGLEIRGLSMGMSNDFEIAVEEGATEVRVGTEIFGRRLQ